MSEEGKQYRMPFTEIDRPIDRLVTKYGVHMQLHSLRVKYHYTQQQLAVLSGLSPGSISRIETGKEVNLKTIIKYADAFGYEIVLRKKDNVWNN